MNLSERLKNAPKTNNLQLCKFGPWLNSLPDDDKTAVESALKDQSWSVAALSAVLIESGCPVGRNSINNHRHGRCGSCYGFIG